MGLNMIDRNAISNVKKQIYNCKGSSVKIMAQKGRKKTDTLFGVIQNTYPSIFVVKLTDTKTNNDRLVSYKYTEVLTEDIVLTLLHN